MRSKTRGIGSSLIVEKLGVRQAAREIDVDPGHLSRILDGKRKLTDAILDKLKVGSLAAKLPTNPS
jgi:plasmid maintenance system antidote protein VapI